jgi:para-aminobenzoate synthetase component 1
MSEESSFKIEDFAGFKRKVIRWAQQFETNICLDNNCQASPYQELSFVLAVDSIRSLKLYDEDNQFEKFDTFQKASKTRIFGYFSYDLKNELEALSSENKDTLNLPSTFFFEPRYIIEYKKGRCIINRSTLEALHIFDQINTFSDEAALSAKFSPKWKTRVNRSAYIENINSIRQDIEEGTVYELNYCREMYVEKVQLSAIETFLSINEQAKAPFSAFLRMGQQFALCFSPERFVQLKGDRLLSQPIKGTVKKTNNASVNEQLKVSLLNDEKERAENVMIVDLVRNDFARSAVAGSVKVEELFGIYEFENIIQMISTVSATKRKDVSALSAIKNAYPMGSMTGAPKIKAMELIEGYEKTKRGLYSGSIGYMKPSGDFDFNVVIRTLIYDESKEYLSFQVGGAITFDSIAEKEWEESEIKAKSILQFLG